MSGFLKRRLSQILVLLMLVNSVVVPAYAAPMQTQETESVEASTEIISGAEGENLTWKLDENGVLTISGTGAMSDYDLEESYPSWYEKKGLVKELIIEEGITSIGNYAFCGCKMLVNVLLPSTLTEIKKSAFMNCVELKQIEIPSKVTVIADHAFAFCDTLERILLPSGLETIEDYAFSYCNNLKDILLPETLKNIGNKIFNGCDNISIEIDEKNENYSVKDKFFLNKDGSKLLGIFMEISGECSIPDGVISIENHVFSDCDNITKVVMSDSVSNIDDYAFYFCSALTNIELSSGLTRIGKNVFTGCLNLINIELPDGLSVIDDCAFEYSGLTSIEIPAGLTKLGALAFLQCKLTSIHVDENNKYYTLSEGVIYNKEKTELVLYPKGKAEAFSVPQSVTSIVYGAFAECSITQISLPENLINIENKAFYGCRGLKTVTVPSKVTDIGDFAFAACVNLQDIKMSSSVKKIGQRILDSCKSLEKLTMQSDAPVVESNKNGVVYLGIGIPATMTISYPENATGYDQKPWTDYKLEPYSVQPENPFQDVPEGEYYHDAAVWAYSNGITSGLDDTHFAPEEACTRGQVVTFLWRAKGKPKSTIAENPFEDVSENEYYYDAILWAYENGISSGLDKTHFAPEETVTRGQFVTFLYRAEGKPSYAAENPFEDVKEGQYYYDAVLWAYENGVTTGLNSKQFGTEEFCTRGQVVTFLHRALK